MIVVFRRGFIILTIILSRFVQAAEILESLKTLKIVQPFDGDNTSPVTDIGPIAMSRHLETTPETHGKAAQTAIAPPKNKKKMKQTVKMVVMVRKPKKKPKRNAKMYNKKIAIRRPRPVRQRPLQMNIFSSSRKSYMKTSKSKKQMSRSKGKGFVPRPRVRMRPPRRSPTYRPPYRPSGTLPTMLPTLSPQTTATPTNSPANDVPSASPTTSSPVGGPSPTEQPTVPPTNSPTNLPTTGSPVSPSTTIQPTANPAETQPSIPPTNEPTAVPLVSPTSVPTGVPLSDSSPTNVPTDEPLALTEEPTGNPASEQLPTDIPTGTPTSRPTNVPSSIPSSVPTEVSDETSNPTEQPAASPPGTEGFFAARMAPATDGQSSNLFVQSGDISGPQDVMCGAIQAVLAHPLNPDICFAGSTNGGVWRTLSCTSDIPEWQPLSNDWESSSVSHMVFDMSDETYNTILVGIGRRSAFFRNGGPHVGLYYTQNALAPEPEWTLLDNSAGEIGFKSFAVGFRDVFARGDLMMAAAYISDQNLCPQLGIFLSRDRGATWTNVLLGQGLALASDPKDDDRFYATMAFRSVCGDFGDGEGTYTSSDGGETWTDVSSVAGRAPLLEGELNNAKLSIHSASEGPSRVWSAYLKNGQAYSIAYSDNFGSDWTVMDDVVTQAPEGGSTNTLNPREKPGGQGNIHFSLLVNPTNPNEIYVGGDRQACFNETVCFPTPNEVGATGFTGRLFRGDASVEPTGGINSPQWEHMTDSDEIGIFPEGGTANSSAPHADSRDMAFRPDGVLLEGNDGGIVIRTSPSDNEGDWFGVCGDLQAYEVHHVAYDPSLKLILFGNQDIGNILGSIEDPGGFAVSLGDGNICMIDHTSDLDVTYFFFGSQRLRLFFRLGVEKETEDVAEFITIVLPGLESSFATPGAMNPAKSEQFALERDAFTVLITSDRGNTFDSILTSIAITAMAFSGNGESLYISGENEIGRCSPEFLLCGTVNFFVGVNYIRNLQVDPNDEEHVYALSTFSTEDLRGVQVIESTDGGNSWFEITDTTIGESGAGGSLSFIQKDSVDKVIVGTSSGIFIRNLDDDGWIVLATGLPVVPVMEIVYDVTDDLLVIATLGRGVWLLEEASVAAATALATGTAATSVTKQHSRIRGTYRRPRGEKN